MSLLSVCTELEENKISDKARNSAKTALAPRAGTGIRDPRAHTPPVQGQDSLEILSPFEQKIRTGLFPKKCLFPQNLHEKATLWFNCELIRFGTDSNGFGTNYLPALRGFYVLMKQTSRTTRKSALSSHFYLLFQVPAPVESSNLSAPRGLCSPA